MRIGHLLAQPRLQPLYRVLLRLAQAGLNVEIGDGAQYTGERHVLEKLLAARQSDTFTVFDVGAHVGEYSATVVDVLGDRVDLWSFEPSSSAFHLLRDRIGSNIRRHATNVGFSEANERRVLFAEREASNYASLVPSNVLESHGVALRPAEQVEVRRLDSFCQEHGIDRIHLLKIDVEGHELPVLNGAGELLRTGAIRAIQFEFGLRAIDSRTFFRDFYTLLSPSYDLYRVLWNGLLPLPEYSESLEIFLTANYLALWRS
jgi:FkbM family methyltransferase